MFLCPLRIKVSGDRQLVASRGQTTCLRTGDLRYSARLRRECEGSDENLHPHSIHITYRNAVSRVVTVAQVQSWRGSRFLCDDIYTGIETGRAGGGRDGLARKHSRERVQHGHTDCEVKSSNDGQRVMKERPAIGAKMHQQLVHQLAERTNFSAELAVLNHGQPACRNKVV